MKPEEILAKLVEFDTVADKQNSQILQFVTEYLDDYGFTTRQIGQNLVAERGQNARIGFSSHTDTVPVTSGWQTNPFVLTTDGDKLFGLGACDMKGGMAVAMWVASQTTQPLKMFFTSDEENSLTGIKELVEKGEKFPSLMIIPEPTNNVPIVATKGVLELTLDFSGKSAHSSTPDEGDNAIYKATDFVQLLRKFVDDLEGTNESFSIPETTLNVAQISGGTAINTVPDSAKVHLECRIISDDHRQQILDFANGFDAKLTVGVDVSTFINSNNISAIEALTSPKTSANYLTEASLMPVNNVVILGPGPVVPHQTNEYVSQKSLHETANVFVKIINDCYT